MLLKALRETTRFLLALPLFAALLLGSFYLVHMSGEFGLRTLGVNINARLIYFTNVAFFLNLLAAFIGFVFAVMGVYRLAYMHANMRQRLVFFRKELSYFAYLALMLGFVLPYLILWVSALWRITKEHLSHSLLIF